MRRIKAARATAATKVNKSEEQWRSELSPQQYNVLRKGRTELPFTGQYVHVQQNGSYCCAGCGNELFRSDTKFESGTGWPSFTEPADRANVDLHDDYSYGMHRVEVTCKACGGHLGHVFPDGPGETGERYCINSCSLEFDEH